MSRKLQISFSVDGKRIKTKTIKHAGPETDESVLNEFVSAYITKMAEYYESSTVEEKHSL